MADAILIVDDRRDVLELSRILLESEGYTTDACAYAEATPQRLRESAPRVVLLDLTPGDTAPWELLQRLRRDESTRDVGVVVTSDTPPLVERALRDDDLGVAAGLVMPFDIETLFDAIGAAKRKGRTSDHTGTSTALQQRVAAVLRQRCQRIITRWVQRLSTLQAFRDRPALSLQEVQGRAGDLIAGAADALALQASTLAIPASPAGVCIDAARDHARLRRAQGLSPADLARELVALRREIWREVRSELGRDLPAPNDLWGLETRLYLTLDESLFAMLDAYGEEAAP